MIDLLQLDATLPIDGYLTDRYTWSDSAGGRRSAALVRTDLKGGHAKQFTYRLPDGTIRVVSESPMAGGCGYIVSHLRNPRIAERHGQDDAPLGSSLNAAQRSVFVGNHHAIHEVTLNYPRWGADPNTGADTRYDMPVTIHWLFATGRDHPLWSVTFDLSQAPADAVDADTRAPYGDMNFDGAPKGTWGDELGGVAWGETNRFTIVGAPFTLTSPWDWSAPNAWAPYNLVWTANVDAEMGIAGTQVIGKQDAGGYEGLDGRGMTSAQIAYRCAAEGYVMPCTWGWPYQSANYGFADTVSATNVKRLAWGADWGYLGKQTVTTINGNVISGWPRVSYSAYIVLGPHSQNPTYGAAQQAAVVEATIFTATVGTVLLQGPPGVNRADTITYSPPGYNPTYGTWEASADITNNATLTFSVTGDTALNNPVIVLHNYAGPAIPASLTLDGVALQPDLDVFLSYRADTQDLWLTLNQSLIGDHTLAISNG